MHMQMNFLLKSHLYVVLWPMKTVCHKLRMKTQVCYHLSQKLSNAKPSGLEFDKSPDLEKKVTPNVPPAKSGKLNFSVSWKARSDKSKLSVWWKYPTTKETPEVCQ